MDFESRARLADVIDAAGGLCCRWTALVDVNATRESAAPAKCGTCESLQQAPLACQECHQVLSHVQGADYFELFGLPQAYEIDQAELSKRYLSISRNIHPDKFAAGDGQMQSFALRMSAAVNKAYEVLRDDFLRAEYLLESAGGLSAAQDKRVAGELLTEVMMLREELEEARASADKATISRIAAEVGVKRDHVRSMVASLCERLEGSGEDVKASLRQELNSLKYLNNLAEQAAS
ncbi:MAG TPA: Fe-S protein assembly co-chaperone HscB [Phycisphaerae bacterium]|nr:Fe-S protein assembly co-chaperone HscB [Phycisphaerae bacterium]